VAPETIVATKFVNDTPPAVQMTGPLCVFPKVAKYRESGNTSIAANFTCVADEPDFNQTPAPKFGPRGVRSRRTACSPAPRLSFGDAGPHATR
jgi:feruloyl esterase